MKSGILDFLPRPIVERIAAMHQGPERGYHSWSHPLALLQLHREVAEQLHDADAVAAAILLHDAIYDPRRSDNETRSAELAADTLAPYLSAPRVQRVRRLIEATAAHSVPDGLAEDEAADLRLFLDMDLSILGAPEADFEAYEAGVRHEYRHVEADVFAARRAEILERFLAWPHLYLTEWGQSRYEERARANVRRSIERLRAVSG